jgi:hypothetical protein
VWSIAERILNPSGLGAEGWKARTPQMSARSSSATRALQTILARWHELVHQDEEMRALVAEQTEELLQEVQRLVEGHALYIYESAVMRFRRSPR